MQKFSKVVFALFIYIHFLNAVESIPPTLDLVVLKSPDYTFEMKFTGLAMQPFANNLDYAAEAIPFNYGDARPILSPSWLIPEIDTDFHFGFDLALLGVFHNANSCLALNWQWYHSPDDDDTFTVSSSDFMIGPFFEIGPDASSYKTAKGKVNFHFDEINLNYGTFVHFGKVLDVNFFTGVSFGRIVQHRFTRFSDLTGTTVRTIDVPSKFIGAGPQLGFDFTYNMVRGFQFVGRSRATLFVGKFKNHTNYTTVSNDLIALGDIPK